LVDTKEIKTNQPMRALQYHSTVDPPCNISLGSNRSSDGLIDHRVGADGIKVRLADFATI